MDDTVTQADRILAADILDEVSDLLCHVGIGQVADLIRDREYDEHEVVSIIRRHRQAHQPDSALADVATERKRQIEIEGWTPEHDDEHDDTQLAGAAACYALATVAHWAARPAIAQLWPWDASWWKPADDPRRNLVKAGALILAEIERLDRITALGGSNAE
jgi:hypothetical protein